MHHLHRSRHRNLQDTGEAAMCSPTSEPPCVPGSPWWSSLANAACSASVLANPQWSKMDGHHFPNAHPRWATGSACPGSEDPDSTMSLATIQSFGPSCFASMPWRSEETWVDLGDLAAPFQKKQPADNSAVLQMWWQSGTLSPRS